MILVKNDRVLSWEKFSCKEILVACLSGIGCSHNATRNKVLGSGHFLTQEKGMQGWRYDNNTGK